LFRHSSQLLATGAGGGAKSGPTAQPAKMTSSAAAIPRPTPMTAPRRNASRSVFPLSRQVKVWRNDKADRKVKAGRARSQEAKSPRKEIPAIACLRILSSIGHPVG
jgi:hypothetical protein